MSHACTKCRGTGKCPVCGGSGKFNSNLVIPGNSFRDKDVCPFCRGQQHCSECHGAGQVEVDGQRLFRTPFS